MPGIETHYVSQFSRNVRFLLDQGGLSRLEPFVESGTHEGKQASPVDQVGSTEVTWDRPRKSDTVFTDISSDRRWVYPHTANVTVPIDKIDEIRKIVDLKSPYARRVAEAHARAKDDRIGEAFFADSRTGEMGATTTAFPAAQKVGVNVGGANSGLNVAKLRAARRILMASGLNMETMRPKIAITAVEYDNLLGELQVTSMDYNDRPTLVDGRVSQFLGFDFVQVEWQATHNRPDGTGVPAYPLSLPYIAPAGLASTARFLPVWVEEGMYLGKWEDLRVEMDERADKNYLWQVWSEMSVGATRLEEKRVVQIAVNSA